MPTKIFSGLKYIVVFVALKTHQIQQTLTMETLDNLDSSLKKCPGEEDEENVSGLKVDLLTHQKQALAWLLWRESQKPAGGILGKHDTFFILFCQLLHNWSVLLPGAHG
jgi:hypothetical protein